LPSSGKRADTVDVLFVDLPDDFGQPVRSWSLGFRYMISSLRKSGFSAELVHAQAPDARRRLIQRIIRSNSALVGFTTYDVSLSAVLRFVCSLRRAGLKSHISLGGVCTSTIPEQILAAVSAVDSVVFGEGEEAIVDLAKRVIRREGTGPIPGLCLRSTAGVDRGKPRPLIADLDSMPVPALDGVAPHENGAGPYALNGRVPVLGSRGCYGRCTFCCLQTYYRSCPGPVWRGRRPTAVADEIEQVARLSGTTAVTFIDENFMGPGAMGRRHAVEIGRELVRQNIGVRFNFGCRPNDIDRETMISLKGAGLAGVTLGIESMGSDALALFNKHTTPEVNYRALSLTEELEVPTEITFMFFSPLATLAEVGANLEFVNYVRRSKFAYFSGNQPFSEFIPFFGAELTQSLVAMGLVRRSLNGYSVKYKDPRVGFIARQVFRVPVASIRKLRRRFEAVSGNQSLDIAAALYQSYWYLNMVRLPELTYDLLQALATGHARTSSKVLSILEAFESERNKIRSLLEKFCSAADRVGRLCTS